MEHRLERLWRRGLDHFQTGNLDAAQASFEGMLAREPKHGPALYRLALIAARREQHDRAIALCERVLANEPPRAEVLLQLARSRLARGEVDAARDAAERAEKVPKPSTEVLDALAVLQTRFGQPRRALALFERALRDAPKVPGLHFNRALVLRSLGEGAAAARELETCIGLQPDHAKAHWVLADVRTATPTDNRVARLRARLAALRKGNPAEDYYAYALFKELDDLGEPALAWPALAQGLRARRARQQYDAAAEHARVQAMIDEVDPLPAPPARPAGPEPIFVVGVPRSGVGVLAEVLARHPAIDAPAAHNHFSAALARPRDDGGPPDVADVRRRYYAATVPAGSTAAFVLDRQPMNFLHVPAIRRVFPEAKLLHVERDPVDACFGQLSRLFPEHGMAIASPGELADAYRDYRRMMAAWHARFPGALLDVSYESLVAKPEMVLRVVFAFLGLRFDRAVLEGEPLHARRVGAARRYAAWLPELRALAEATPAAPS
jgi:tetratricopeptide (TPR) repeat protein